MDSRLGSATNNQLNQTQSPQTITDQGLGTTTLLQNQNSSPINNLDAKIVIPVASNSSTAQLNSDQAIANASLTPLYIGGGAILLFLAAIVILAIKSGAKQPNPVN